LTQQWLEFNDARDYLNVGLEHLCDLVINNDIEAIAEQDQLYVDVSSVPKNYLDKNTYERRNIDSLKHELVSIKLESAWLKSENMKNSAIIDDYYERFNKLKNLQEELVSVINQQSETIRVLKGYKKKEVKVPVEKKPQKNQQSLGISIWMLLPLIGLVLTAIIEVMKASDAYWYKGVFSLLGIG
jgi:hypothetical protein